MIPDGPEERTALADEQAARADAETHDEDSPIDRLSAIDPGLAESMAKVRAAIITLRDERDHLRSTLQDIILGTDVILDTAPQSWPESAMHYANEVRRIAAKAVGP